MKTLTRLALVIGCFFTSQSHANDSEQLQNKLQNIASFEANFQQVVRDGSGEEIMQGAGKLALKQPMMIRWQQQVPDETLFVSNGEKTYYFDSFAEQVTIMNTHSLIDSTPFVLLTSQQSENWNKYQVKAIDNGYSVTPKPGVTSQVEQLDITFNTNKTALSALSVVDTSGQTSVFTFSDAKVNQPLNAAMFEFTVPQGVEVDDQSQGE